MLFQKNQKKISSILRTIYKPSLNERDIDHGDNINSNQKSSIQVFQNFFRKNLKKYFNAIHF